jgi:hypothetical protein
MVNGPRGVIYTSSLKFHKAIIEIFTPGHAHPSRLPPHEILSRAARGLTPCPGPRAHLFRTRMLYLATIDAKDLMPRVLGSVVAGRRSAP